MKIGLALIVLFLPAFARADASPSPSPNIEPGKVLILPFEQIGGDASQRFITRALQQSLLSALTHPTLLHPVELQPSTQPSDSITAQSAMQLGLSNGAQYVVFGSYQFAGPDLRITGQLISTGSGAVVANLRSTGSMRDLFAMEDNIAGQARRALIPPVAAGPVPQTLPPVPAPIGTADGFEGSALQQSLLAGRNYNRNNFQNDYNRYYLSPYPTPYYYYPYYNSPYYTAGYGYSPFSGFIYSTPGVYRSR